MVSTRTLRALGMTAVVAVVAAIAASAAVSADSATVVRIWTDADRKAAVEKVAGAWATAKGVEVEVVQKDFGKIRDDQLGDVFQHDIRRALVRLGQNVSRFGRTHEISHALDEVVEAAEHLARTRIGGIVVFERDVGLVVDDALPHRVVG